jgi:hypothetical protein
MARLVGDGVSGTVEQRRGVGHGPKVIIGSGAPGVAENADWVPLHREGPLEVPHAA